MVINLTFHPYFNLLGAGTQNLKGQKITIAADKILEFGKDSIATGKSLSIADTPFDFREPKEIDFEQVMQTQWRQDGEGIDHFYILTQHDEKLRQIAPAESTNGVRMEIWIPTRSTILYV